MREHVRQLRAEARRSNERRLLVCHGAPDATRDAAREALDAADIPSAETTLVGPEPFLDCERHETVRATELLGRTRTAVVLDCHDACRPNAIGASVGAVDGGGLLVVLAPPLDEWPDRRDAFDEGLAVPPFGVDAVSGHFRRRLVETLRAHRGVSVVDAASGTVERSGCYDPAPRRPASPPTPPADHDFPTDVYAACRTADQVDAVAAFEPLAQPGSALVLSADRGRGKSSAAGLASAALAADGLDVLVTAPQYRAAQEVFERARERLAARDALASVDDELAPQSLETCPGGAIRYATPAVAAERPADPDLVVVDEAAALPVRRLESFLDAPSVAFASTVHGYEGAGRGFSVRFRDRLAESDLEVTERTMTTPIRYGPADPVETWAFRALLLDARPAVDPVVEGATPDAVDYQTLEPADLRADEHLLREVFGLLVLAHYRTEPDDLARLLDAPNVSVRALLWDGHVVSVALLAREGGLSEATRAAMHDGERVRGNMIPDVLTTQLQDRDAGVPVGQRVLRIATHPVVRRRGLGSALLGEIRAEFAGGEGGDDVDDAPGPAIDWLGVGFGATPGLVAFWAANDYGTVHLSTTRNDASGEYSAVMLDALTDAGESLLARHAEGFLARIPGVLSDPLDDLSPDVARAALAAANGTPDLALSDRQWRQVRGVPAGATTFDTDPEPFRKLAIRTLVNPADTDALDAREKRLLVRKVLQGRAWDGVAEDLGFVSTAECMRALADAVETLLDRYDPHRE